MKKIINPWEGLDGYMCFGCAPSNPMGLHMEFYEMVMILWLIGSRKLIIRVG